MRQRGAPPCESASAQRDSVRHGCAVPNSGAEFGSTARPATL